MAKPSKTPQPVKPRKRRPKLSEGALADCEPEGPRMLWDRAPQESDQAFAAFKAYRDFGLDRTLLKAAEKVGKCIRLICRWSAEWKWRERVEAWDTEQDRLEQQANAREVRKMRKRHAETGMLLLAKAVQKLVKVDPATLGALTLLRYIEAGAKLEARARGDAEERVQQELAVAPGQRVVQTFTICGQKIEF